MKQCKENNCQLIVTTHSKESLESLISVIAGNGNDSSLLRTEPENGKANVSSLSSEEVAAAIDSGCEVR